MKNMLSKKASAWVLAGTASLVVAVAATAAIAGSEDPVLSISAAERAAASTLASPKRPVATSTPDRALQP
jgi:hypothetical protein